MNKAKPHSYKNALIRLKDIAQHGKENATAESKAAKAAGAAFAEFPARKNDALEAWLKERYQGGRADALSDMEGFIERELNHLDEQPEPLTGTSEELRAEAKEASDGEV